MPEIDDITYSREECITAILEYYEFLADFYLDESLLIKPPKGGWPSITAEMFKDMDKTSEVIALLRQLQYINYEVHDAQGVSKSCFADWRLIGTWLENRSDTGEGFKFTTEDPANCEQVPPHVIGLTCGGRGTVREFHV